VLYRTLKLIAIIFLCASTSTVCAKEAEHDGRYNDLPELLVFISFSMPDQSLQQLIEQIKKTDGVLVLRGMHKNSMKESLKKIHELNNKGVRAVIDPVLFKRFAIENVPSFVIHQPTNNCFEAGKCTPIFDKLAGNVPLSYVMEQFESSGTLTNISTKYLKSLRGQNG